MEQNDEIACFFTYWYKWKFEVDEKYWGGVGQKLVWTLWSQEGINGINWFFHAIQINRYKLKVINYWAGVTVNDHSLK